MKTASKWLDGYSKFYMNWIQGKKLTTIKDHRAAKLAYIRLIQKDARVIFPKKK